jgi:hypothetical protein
MVVTPNEDASVAIVVAMIPSVMQPTITFIELDAGATIVTVAIVAMVAAYIEAKSRCAGYRRRSNGDGRQRCQNVKELPHGSFSVVVTQRKTNAASARCRNTKETFLNSGSPSLPMIHADRN